MTTNGRINLTYVLLLAALIVISSIFNFSQYVLLTFLPAMIMCLPVTVSTVSALFIAFFSGFAIDFFSTGLMGLSSAALLPVALLRIPILKLIFGSEIFARRENLSIKKHGQGKIIATIIVFTSIYLLAYIIIDSAGTRTFLFNTTKFICSLICSFLVSLLASLPFTSDN